MAARSSAINLPPLRELGLSQTRRRDGGGVAADDVDMVEPPSASTPQDHMRMRHSASWQRPGASAHLQQGQQSAPTYQQQVYHQQLTPPLSAGHDYNNRSIEYATKHDRPSYMTPGAPLSAQLTPAPGSVNIGPGVRSDDAPHLQQTRRREQLKPTRNSRQSQPSYPPPSAPYTPSQPTPTSPVYQTHHSMPPPSAAQRSHPVAVHAGSPMQDQMPPQPSPVTPTHPAYHYYQQQPRPTHIASQHPPQHQSSATSYPSPAPPASAPPTHEPWEQLPSRSQHTLQRQYPQSTQNHQHQPSVSQAQASHTHPQQHAPQPPHHAPQPHHPMQHPNGHHPHLSRVQTQAQYQSPVQTRQPLQQHPSVQHAPPHINGPHSHAQSPPTPQSALPTSAQQPSHPPPTPQSAYPSPHVQYPSHHPAQAPPAHHSHPPPSAQPQAPLAGSQQVQSHSEYSRPQISPRTPQQSQPSQHIPPPHHQPSSVTPQPRSYQSERPTESYPQYSQFQPTHQPPQHSAPPPPPPPHQPQHSPQHSAQNVFQHPPPQPQPHHHHLQYSSQPHTQSHPQHQPAPPSQQPPPTSHYQRTSNGAVAHSVQPSHPAQPPQPPQQSHIPQSSHPSHTPEPVHHHHQTIHQPHAQHLQQRQMLSATPVPAPIPVPAPAPAPPPPQQHHQPPQYQHQPESQQAQSVMSHPPPTSSAQAPPPSAPFSRTTTLIPPNVDTTRTVSFAVTDPEKMSARDFTMSEIVKHCRVLYDFAARYANLSASLPQSQPSPQECADMAWRAKEVVRLLEALRRMSAPEADRIKADNASATSAAADDHRPPKRPWEDIAQGGQGDSSFSEFPAAGDKEQSTAEKDMEIIRTKRATSTAGGNATSGQPKSKYRKRSRATPPGKCHSCNIRETPEWRRGPDGARTLCNACGLHYAKLMRKREKQHGNNPDAPRIDMETLRASARAADAEKQSSRSSKQAGQSNDNSDSGDHGKNQNSQPQGHHQGSFQVMQVTTPTDMASRMQNDHVQTQSLPTPASATTLPPPPPWATSASSSRGYPLQEISHQSFMRSSDHGSSNHTSPR